MKPILKNRIIIICIVVFATLYSLLFLNRWVFSNVSVEIFARVWQYYVGYQDVGFARRLLVGTVLSVSHITDFFQNEFVFAHVFHSFTIIALAGFFLHYILRQHEINKPYQYLPVFFSPVFIQQMGTTTGTLDVILILLAAISIFYVKNLRGIFLISVVGLFVHELFVFLIPSILLIHALQEKRSVFTFPYLWSGLGLICIFSGITLLGKIEIDKEVYEQMVAEKIPIAAYKHNLWSGYFELTTSVKENIIEGGGRLLSKYLTHFSCTIIPTCYLFFFLISVAFQKSMTSDFTRILLFLSFCFPLTAVFFAIDYYRWVGLSANLGVIYMVYLMGQKQFFLQKWQWVVLFLCCLLAPFGGNELHIPFPLHQPLLEKAGF